LEISPATANKSGDAIKVVLAWILIFSFHLYARIANEAESGSALVLVTSQIVTLSRPGKTAIGVKPVGTAMVLSKVAMPAMLGFGYLPKGTPQMA